MSLTREENVYMSKLSEQAERYEDMVKYMKEVATQNPDLSTEERNLLSVAYKNAVGARRTAWRAISALEQKEEAKGSRHVNEIRNYRSKVE